MTVVDKVDCTTVEHVIKTGICENKTIKTDGLSVYTIVGKK